MILCIHCQHINQIGTLHCENCGFPLVDNDTSTEILDESVMNSEIEKRSINNQQGTSQFDIGTTITLQIDDSTQRVTVHPTHPIILGRGSLNTPEGVMLDLTEYGAVEKGVSRLHAVIHYHINKLVLVDMGSQNGTYVNGNRLTTGVKYTIRNGDHLLIGKLAMEVMFNIE